jgi:hypothetical protein
LDDPRIFHGKIKEDKGNNHLPHSAAIIVFLLALCHYCTSLLPFRKSASLCSVAMGKRSSSIAGAAAAKKAKTKTADANTPAVGNWVQTKFLEKDLQHAAKVGILKDDPAEVRITGPEIIPRPPAGFRVLFLAFFL